MIWIWIVWANKKDIDDTSQIIRYNNIDNDIPHNGENLIGGFNLPL